MARFHLAFLSDPHLGPVPRPSARALMSKRAFGYINWLRNRRAALGSNVLQRIVDDIKTQAPDHIAVTGDLVNIALPEEFDAAAAWLETLGPPEDVTVVPGNHDAYVRGGLENALAAWGPYMASDTGPQTFPIVRRRNGIVLLGVSTAVATPPLWATGKVGGRQRDALGHALDKHDDAFKVVLIHHPPDAGLSPGRRRLVDHAAVRQVLSDGCADLVLHGHNHEPSIRWLPTAHADAAVIGTPSASSDGSKHALASYGLIELNSQTGHAHLTRRGLTEPDGRVRVLEGIDLVSARAANH
ncbi:MAG: metallophosphoesterase [Pseudomonadota bacterium]